MYENGQGVPRAYKLSYALFELSGKNDLRTNLMKKMSSEQIDKAQRLSKILTQPGNLNQALNAEIVRVQKDQGFEQASDKSNARNKQFLDKWIGRGDRDLLIHKYWGIPTQSYETDGIKFLAYDFSETVVSNGIFVYSCKVIFETQAGRLGRWFSQGLSCDRLLTVLHSP